MADTSPAGRKNKHILGRGGSQIILETGVEALRAIVARAEDDGRTLDKEMVDLRTPRGQRAYVSKQLSDLSKVKLFRGANPIETVYRSLGDLIVIGRSGVKNVYVAKDGATPMELVAFCDLKLGKANATVANMQELTAEIKRGVDALSSIGVETLGEGYAETVAKVFQALDAA